MKAAYFMKNGGPEVMQYGEVPDPVAGPGQVLVDVHAASVNGADWKGPRPATTADHRVSVHSGRDFSLGRRTGRWGKDFAIGDAVFGVCEVTQEAAYAEKKSIKAAIVARKPEKVTHVECAAVGLIGLTALCSVEDTLELKSGETILIQGGAGGVASFAIQLAKHIGARVITTASKANHDYLRGLGADEIIDYNAQDFTKAVSGCDAVFDTVGGEVAKRSFTVLRPRRTPAFIASGTRRRLRRGRTRIAASKSRA